MDGTTGVGILDFMVAIIIGDGTTGVGTVDFMVVIIIGVITHFGALPFMVVDFMVVGLLTMAGVIIEDTTTEVSTIIEGKSVTDMIMDVNINQEKTFKFETPVINGELCTVILDTEKPLYQLKKENRDKKVLIRSGDRI